MVLTILNLRILWGIRSQAVAQKACMIGNSNFKSPNSICPNKYLSYYRRIVIAPTPSSIWAWIVQFAECQNPPFKYLLLEQPKSESGRVLGSEPFTASEQTLDSSKALLNHDRIALFNLKFQFQCHLHCSPNQAQHLPFITVAIDGQRQMMPEDEWREMKMETDWICGFCLVFSDVATWTLQSSLGRNLCGW